MDLATLILKEKFQLDHILISSKFARSLVDCRAYNSKFLEFSDHRVLIARFKLRLTGGKPKSATPKSKFRWLNYDRDFYSRISEKLLFRWTELHGFLSKVNSLKWLDWSEKVISSVAGIPLEHSFYENFYKE